MNNFSDVVHRYWKSQMINGDIVHFDELLTLVSNPKLDDSYKMMILEMTNKHIMVVANPVVASELKLSNLKEYSIASLRKEISKCKLVLHPADYIYYLPYNKVPNTPEAEDGIIIRVLNREFDKQVFNQFESICTEDDLDGAYVSLDHWVVYGAFDKGILIGVCSMYTWDSTKLADLGVIIADPYRGRGIGTRLVKTISRDVVSKGYVPQYRCQTDNKPSIALAEASGFDLFGEWEVIV